MNNRKIDKLYKAKNRIDSKIEKLQAECKHEKTIPTLIFGIPGITGYFNVCSQCEKTISLNEELTNDYFSKQSNVYYEANFIYETNRSK